MVIDYLGVYGVCIKDNRVLSIKKTRGPYKNRYDLPGGSQNIRRDLLKHWLGNI